MMKRKVVPGKGEEEIILFLWQEGFEKHGWRESVHEWGNRGIPAIVDIAQ